MVFALGADACFGESEMSQTHAVLINSLAVLVPFASPLSRPGSVYPSDLIVDRPFSSVGEGREP